MDIQFDNRYAIHFFWAVPGLLIVFLYGFHRRREALAAFSTANLTSRLVSGVSFARRRVRVGLVLIAVVCLITALTGPRWGVHFEDVQRRGIDIIFCLDVSRSMLAEDVSPNRLERAKQYIRDVVERLAGDRVGLVTFAGGSVVKCPLTIDYGTFRMVLGDAGIRSSARGGTLIGDAVRMAAGSFADEVKKYKAIILITDGEDQESYPVEAATTAFSEQGIRIYTIGIGDLDDGARIPITQNGQRTYLQHDGQEVWSKLDTKTLEHMALAGGGAYVPAGISQVDMGQIYEQKIATSELREFEASRIKRYDVQYQWFAGLAFVLLMIESLMTERKRSAVIEHYAVEKAA
jgi:Ca-activated chloride channel family protein